MAAMAADPSATPERVTVYGACCPLSCQCKKGDQRFKDYTEENARWRIQNHLQTSTYHNLPRVDAETIMQGVEIETWEEDAKQAKRDHEWDASETEWTAKRMRPGHAMGSVPSQTDVASTRVATPAMVRQAFGNPTTLMRMDRSRAERVLTGMEPDAQIVLNGHQAQIIMDSLSRARASTLCCQQVASSALQAFTQEHDRLVDLQEVMMSWIRQQ